MEQDPSLLSLMAFPVLVVLYVLPTIVALGRGKDGKLLVALLNLLLGWTIVGWVVALILALTGETVTQRRRKEEELSLMRARSGRGGQP